MKSRYLIAVGLVLLAATVVLPLRATENAQLQKTLLSAVTTGSAKDPLTWSLS